MVTADRVLTGVRVMVTRPAHQAEALCTLIQRQGGSVCRFPVLEILEPLDPGPLQAIIPQLEQYDWAVFISANAVERALTPILAVRSWPVDTRIAVIGRRSAQALQHYGLEADLFPTTQFNSEALLALPALQQIRNQRFVIFRGNGGREYLATTLRRRGAQVDYIEAYRRVRPSVDPLPLVTQWQREGVDIIVVNSAESLKNLVTLLGEVGAAWLRRTRLLLVSERQVPLAQQLGFEQSPLVAENATDEAVLQALCQWRQGPAC